MKFSVGLGRGVSFEELAEEAQVAEESGFSHLTVVDQQNLDRDVYVLMTAVAIRTSRILIGQGVTLPASRHPAVTANATASVDEVSGGRAFLGIGAGGNALRSMGAKAPPLRELRATVEFVKRYVAGEEAEYGGYKMRSGWIRRAYPIYMAASGPKALQLAGELADGVITVGANPELVKWRLELIRRGAERVGRDPSTIDIWVRNCMVIGESREEARRQAAAYAPRTIWLDLGADNPEAAELRRRLAKTVKDVDGLIADSKRVFDAYDEYMHERSEAPHAQFVTQRMIDFMHLTGSSDEVRARISELQSMGIEHISNTMFTLKDRKEMMRRIGTEIISAFGD